MSHPDDLSAEDRKRLQGAVLEKARRCMQIVTGDAANVSGQTRRQLKHEADELLILAARIGRPKVETTSFRTGR